MAMHNFSCFSAHKKNSYANHTTFFKKSIWKNRVGVHLLPLFVLMLCFKKESVFAQVYKQNFGLTAPLDSSLLPIGNHSGIWMENILADIDQMKRDTIPFFTPDGSFVLRGNWFLAEASAVLSQPEKLHQPFIHGSEWIPASVPGTVLTSLVQQKVHPHPYYGLNNLFIPEDLNKKQWVYKLVFDLPKEKQSKQYQLSFNGVNYQATYWLNGKKLGSGKGAFQTFNFDVSDCLYQDKPNVLVALVSPPNNPGIPHEQSAKSGMGPNGGQLAMDGPTFISSEGWDWVPAIRDRNTGIWQDVVLHPYNQLFIEHIQVITDLPLPDTTSAEISLHLELKGDKINPADYSNYQLQVEWDGRQFSIGLHEAITEQKEGVLLVQLNSSKIPGLKMKHPKLWWPNGYGQQCLYVMKVELRRNNQLMHKKQARFGIREFSYDITALYQGKRTRFQYSPTDWNKNRLSKTNPFFNFADRKEVAPGVWIPQVDQQFSAQYTMPAWGDSSNPYLNIRINGVPIFCKGGNWGMDDAMKQSSRSRLEPAFQLHKAAHFNMIRNWTGESTESVFYELADEYGMLVWNDYWLSTEGYNLPPNDEALTLENAKSVVRKYVNHPSIAIWCPRNEGYAPDGLAHSFALQIQQLDGTRHYHGNSRNMNLRPSGDWHHLDQPLQYFTKYADGFTTEIGTFSVPEFRTLQKFIPPADLWPIGDVWHYHDLHANKVNLEGYLNTTDSIYGKSKNAQEFASRVQLVNYDRHRMMFEAWNAKMWKDASGILLWMSHPAWPSMIWQTYSWDFGTHGAFYGSAKANEPLHVQFAADQQSILVVKATPETPVELKKIKVIAQIFNPNGTAIQQELYWIKSANDLIYGPQMVGGIPLGWTAATNNSPVLVRLSLQIQSNSSPSSSWKTISVNDYWFTGKEKNLQSLSSINNIGKSKITVRAEITNEDGRFGTIVLHNQSDKICAGVRVVLKDKTTGKEVLPTILSDNYINLLPGEKRSLQWKCNISVLTPIWEVLELE